jgi:predicted secreted Zn-dependent protease
MSFPQPLRVERDDAGSYRLPAFTVRVAPDRSHTLVRRSIQPSRELLRHEQGHYDLVVLAARALARELDAVRADSPREVARLAEDLVAEHTRRAERLSQRYDEETSHGRELAAQSAWSANVAAALAAPAVATIAGMPL